MKAIKSGVKRGGHNQSIFDLASKMVEKDLNPLLKFITKKAKAAGQTSHRHGGPRTMAR